MTEQECIEVFKELLDVPCEMLIKYDSVATEKQKKALVKIRVAEDMAVKALEKQIPQSVKLYIGQDMKCPSCNNRLRNYEGVMIGYCKFCGQLLIR